ncbi:hypothetical protein D3C78_1703480 [compost metagenome]
MKQQYFRDIVALGLIAKALGYLFKICNDGRACLRSVSQLKQEHRHLEQLKIIRPLRQ